MSTLNFINHIFHGFNDLVSDVSHFFLPRRYAKFVNKKHSCVENDNHYL